MDMKPYLPFFLLILGISGCNGGPADNSAPEPQPRTEVTLTRAVHGNIRQEIVFPATTVYLNRSKIAAPIPAFVTASYVEPGTRVRAGQTLFRIESKERHALGDDSAMGLVPIKAEHDGIVVSVEQQAGDYVAEGATLCTIAYLGSLVFELSIPYEQKKYARLGARFILELPDGTRFPARVTSSLPTMDTAAQTERIIARADAPLLPEGMRAKAVFTTGGETAASSLVVPKSAVQSDETLSKHWVMRLVDDSTAVKVPVEVVCCNADEAEISSEALTPRDRLVLTGGYGLEDGARVTIRK